MEGGSVISPPEFRLIPVSKDLDVALSRKLASAAAEGAGFSQRRVEDIVLAVSEMAQNLVSHNALSGRVLLYAQEIAGIRIMNAAALDEGPGILQPLDVIVDGVSSGSSFGNGLGTIKRLSDRFEICSGRFGQRPCVDIARLIAGDEGREREGGATGDRYGTARYGTVVASSFLSPPGFWEHLPLEMAFYVRPAEGESLSGDGLHFKAGRDSFRMTLLDALGHGPRAADVLNEVVMLLERIPADTPPEEVLLAVGHDMGPRGGLAMHAVKIENRSGRIDTASTGNIFHSMLIDGMPRTLPSGSGIIGPVVSRNNIIRSEISGFHSVIGILYTDGFSQLHLKEQEDTSGISPLLLASEIIGYRPELISPKDDATLLVWRYEPK